MQTDFVYADRRATNCAVVGDFNGWDATAARLSLTDDGVWTGALDLATGSYRYGFLVDGQDFVSDIANPVWTNDGRRIVSLLVVAGAVPRPEPVAFTFRFAALDADSVAVAGDFNEWSAIAHPLREVEPGLWEAEVVVPAQEGVYKFVRDGQWLLDPANAERVVLNGVENSKLVPAQACNVSAKQAMAAATRDALYPALFSLVRPDAKAVFVAGEFNGWSTKSHPMNRDADNTWHATVHLARGDYAYKFVADGEWILDPANPLRKTVDGAENSLARIDASAGDDPDEPVAFGTPVTFTLAAESFRRVSIAGDFNGWDKARGRMKQGGDGIWRRTIHLPPGRHAYKFVAGDHWFPDPGQPLMVESNGVLNSLMVVEAALPEQAPPAKAWCVGPTGGPPLRLEAADDFHPFEQELLRQRLLFAAELAGRPILDGTLFRRSDAAKVSVGWTVDSRNGMTTAALALPGNAGVVREPLIFPDTRPWRERMRALDGWVRRAWGDSLPAVAPDPGRPPAGSPWAAGLEAFRYRDEWGFCSAINQFTRHGRQHGWNRGLLRDLSRAYAELATAAATAQAPELPVYSARAAICAWLAGAGEGKDENLSFVLLRIGRPADAAAWLPATPTSAWGRVALAGLRVETRLLEPWVGLPGEIRQLGLASPDAVSPTPDYEWMQHDAGRFAVADLRTMLGLAHLEAYLGRHPESLEAWELLIQKGHLAMHHRWSRAALARAAETGRWDRFAEGHAPPARPDPAPAQPDFGALVEVDRRTAALAENPADAVPASARRSLLLGRLASRCLDHAKYLANIWCVEEATRAFGAELAPVIEAYPMFGPTLGVVSKFDRTNRTALAAARMAEWQDGRGFRFALQRAWYATGLDRQRWTARAVLARSDHLYDGDAGVAVANLVDGRVAARVEALAQLGRLHPAHYYSWCERRRIDQTVDYRARGLAFCSNSFGFATYMSTTLGWTESIRERDRARGIYPYDVDNLSSLTWLSVIHNRYRETLEYARAAQGLPDAGLNHAQIAGHASIAAEGLGDFAGSLRHAEESAQSYAAWALSTYAMALARNGRLPEALKVLEGSRERYGPTAAESLILHCRIPAEWTNRYAGELARLQAAVLGGGDVPEDLRERWDAPLVAYWTEISGEPDLARRVLQAVIKDPAAHSIGGWLLYAHALRTGDRAATESLLDTFCNSARFADRKLAEFLRGRRGLVSGRSHAIPYQEGGQHMLALAAVAAARGDAVLERRCVAEALGPYNRNHITFAIAWSWMHRRGWDPRRYVDVPASGPSGRPAP